MKEHSIRLVAPEVRAILGGKKTQTRRAIKQRQTPYMSIEENDDGKLWPWRENPDTAQDCWYPCPYGQPGDRLWARETWAPHPDYPESTRRAIYRADPGAEYDVPRWRPSIHMPRWASRITLEITGVRVERLQDIRIADAMAEGVDEFNAALRGLEPCMEWSYAYEDLWEQINGKGAWAANPWVWVIEFKRVEP